MSFKMKLPDQQDLLEHLEYNKETGIIKWIKKPPRNNCIQLNVPAGSIVNKHKPENMYLAIGFKSKLYLVHRIIWKMVTGDDPIEEIDHRDCNGLNNKWDNLREATRPNNQYNTFISSNNTSGTKGIDFVKREQKWRARITNNGKCILIGYYFSLEEASAARKEYAERTRNINYVREGIDAKGEI